jgi:predicted PurR-regulated permease PerM
MGDRIFTVSISTGTVIKTLLLILAGVLLYILRDLALIVLTAIVIASAVEPAAGWFQKRRIPRVIAVLIVYLIFFAFFFLFFYFFLPPVLSEAVTFMTTLPAFLETLNTEGGASFGEASAVIPLPGILTEVQAVLTNVSGNTIAAASAIFGGVVSFILILVFSFYFAVQETGIDDFLRIITPVKHQKYVIDLWRRSQYKIGLWMQGQLLLCLIVGVLVYLGLTILGVPYALVLAVVAALFELIPVFGPILAAVPAVIVALSGDGVTLALLVVALYVIIQQFENHLIYPLVVTKVVGVPPLLVILALLIGGQLAGFLGVLLSVPIAAAIQEFVHDVQHRRGYVFGREEPAS